VVLELAVLVLGAAEDLEQLLDQALQVVALWEEQVLAEVVCPRRELEHARDLRQVLLVLSIQTRLG